MANVIFNFATNLNKAVNIRWMNKLPAIPPLSNILWLVNNMFQKPKVGF